ncbi:hypothetical protein EhVM1_000205 [Emiliania huxleyi virus M1]|nr:hypothetical protein EhVM1_000205 [Emiliania huxleyi virus M1]
MANSGIRWIQVILILGFIILQIILINKKQYTTAMIASVIYIPCAYFIKRFLFASSATVAIIHRQKLLNANTNDNVLRDTIASQSTESPTVEHALHPALRQPGTKSIPGRRVQFTNIAPLKQNQDEMLSSVAQLARIGPVTNREDIQIPLPILTDNGQIITPFQPVPRSHVRETPTSESIASDQERVRQRLSASLGEFRSRSNAFNRMKQPLLPDYVPDPSKPQIW